MLLQEPTAHTTSKLTTRRKDPNYTQVTSHVPKELAKRLKIYCAEAETTITEVVEDALREYLNQKESDR